MDALYKDEYEKLGLNLAYYRKHNKLTQQQLGELIDVDNTHISKIELGVVGVSLDNLFRLSKVLKVPVYKFFEFKD
ncbi:MAG: helix-turn-helix domain-containing protein [Oscillospiraceae bacterium]|nr:helix-turn-helix domain-containing protein [Oscillospiraceae bacterium]